MSRSTAGHHRLWYRPAGDASSSELGKFAELGEAIAHAIEWMGNTTASPGDRLELAAPDGRIRRAWTWDSGTSTEALPTGWTEEAA